MPTRGILEQNHIRYAEAATMPTCGELEQNPIRYAEAATMPTRGELEHGEPELIGSPPVTIERPGSRQKDNENIATSEKVATALIHQRPDSQTINYASNRGRENHLQDANTLVRVTPSKKNFLRGTLQSQT